MSGRDDFNDNLKRHLEVIRSEGPPIGVAIVATIPGQKWQVAIMRDARDAELDPETVVAELEEMRSNATLQNPDSEYVVIHRRFPVSDEAITFSIAAAAGSLMMQPDVANALLSGVMLLAIGHILQTIDQRRRCSRAADELRRRIRSFRGGQPTPGDVGKLVVLPKQNIAFCVIAPRS